MIRRAGAAIPARMAAFVLIAAVWLAAAVAPAGADRVWSGAAPDLDGTSIAFNDVACPSMAQCTGVDSNGRAYTWNPTDPGVPHPAAIEGGSALYYVACTGTAQCTAIDRAGYEFTFNPQHPLPLTSSARVNASGIPDGLSCFSATECTAVYQGNQEDTFNPQTGAAISQATLMDSAGDHFDAFDVGCPLADECVAADSSGYADAFDPQTGASVTEDQIDSAGGVLRDLFCVSTGGAQIQCTAALDGKAITFDPPAPDAVSGWAVVNTTTTAGSGSQQIGCPTASECSIFNGNSETTFDPVTAATAPAFDEILATNGNEALSCPSAALCVEATGNGGSVAYDPQDPGNAAATTIDTRGGVDLVGTACTAAGHCTAIDYPHDAVSFSAADPQPATPVTIDSADSARAVDCIPGGSDCVAVDDNGDEIVYDPQHPGTPAVVPVMGATPLNSVQCLSATLCVAVGDGRTVSFDPSAADPASTAVVGLVDTANYLDAVSCVNGTPVQCTAVDNQGNVVTFDPQNPGSPAVTRIDPTATLEGISCPSLTQCTAVASAGGPFGQSTVITLNPQDPGTSAIGQLFVGGARGISCASVTDCYIATQSSGLVLNPQAPGLTTQAVIDPIDGNVDSLSCTTASSCTAVGSAGVAVTIDPAKLPVTATLDTPTAVTGIACGSATQCETVDADGYFEGFAPGANGVLAANRYGQDGTVLSAVTCPSSTECVAVGSDQMFDFTPGFYTSSTNGKIDIDPDEELTALACASSTACVAGDGFGGVLAFDPATTSAPARAAIDEPNVIDGLTCPSASQCTAVDDNGGALTFDPASPGTPTRDLIDPGQSLSAVACPSVSECAATDERGAVVEFDPAQTTSATVEPVDPAGGGLSALACPSATECLAVDGDGNAVEGNPQDATTWTIEPTGLAGPLTGVTCPQIDLCQVAGTDGVVTGAGETVKPGSGGGTTSTGGGTTSTGGGTTSTGGGTTSTGGGTTTGTTETSTTGATTTSGATTTGTTPNPGSGAGPSAGAAALGSTKVSGTSVAVTIACRGAAGARCQAKVTLTVVETLRGKQVTAVAAAAGRAAKTKTKPRKRTVVIGSGSATVTAGQTQTLKIALNAKGRALLKAHPKLTALLSVSDRTSAGTSATVATRRVMFAAPPSKHRR